MLIALTAFDDLKNSGQRTISFEDRSTFPGSLAILAFPEDRGSILHEGIVYDWYGRKASLAPQIEYVVAPFGHSIKGEGLDYCCDDFIVELKNGKYAIASLDYQQHQKIDDPTYTGTKRAITGGALDRAPYINFDQKNWVYDAIDCEFLKGTCFDAFSEKFPHEEFAVGHNPCHPRDESYDEFVIITSEKHGYSYWQMHKIANSREEILSLSTSDWYESVLHSTATNHLFGELIVEGDRLIATARNGQRIATDAEVLAHATDHKIWWYFDPA